MTMYKRMNGQPLTLAQSIVVERRSVKRLTSQLAKAQSILDDLNRQAFRAAAADEAFERMNQVVADHQVVIQGNPLDQG